MDKGFEYQVRWWMPKKPDEKLPGILRFDSWEGETLSLFGSLRAPVGQDDKVPILGPSMDDTPITLTNLNGPPSIPGMSPGKRRPGTSKVDAWNSGKTSTPNLALEAPEEVEGVSIRNEAMLLRGSASFAAARGHLLGSENRSKGGTLA